MSLCTITDIEAVSNGYMRTITILQEKIDQLRKELAQRFERGWELFQQYQNVSTHARQILKAGVFTHDDFMSFICGGAQTNSLEAI